MKNAAIIIEGLSKSYQRGRIRKPDLRSSISSLWLQSNLVKEDFFALQDIDLVIEQGDVVGIVGPNGAGKSTLLKLLSRITFPTKGRMTIQGTLSSMLEVGTGFHPELTGRENIYLNGAIIGMKREEVNRKLDSIVSFSGIESFLDTAVKHYSSGMYVRLAFSVAAHLEPNVLLIDEVLSVGDHEFRKKCLDKLLDVSSQGRTIIMVSHQLSYLKLLCSHGAYFNGGRLVHQGTMDEVINHYVNDIDHLNTAPLGERTDRKGSGKIKAKRLDILDINGQKIPLVTAGQAIVLSLELESTENIIRNFEVRIEFYDSQGHLWFISKNSISGNSEDISGRNIVMNCHFPKFPLNKNIYHLNVAVYAQNELSDEVINAILLEVEPGMYYATGKLPPPNKGMLVDYFWTLKELI